MHSPPQLSTLIGLHEASIVANLNKSQLNAVATKSKKNKRLRKARQCATLGEYEKQMLRAYPLGVSMASRSAVQAFDRGSKSSLSRPTQTQATASDVSKELRLRDSLSSRYGVLIICAVVG